MVCDRDRHPRLAAAGDRDPRHHESKRGRETLSWIVVVFTLPVLGIGVYLLIGELKLGRKRAKHVLRLYDPIRRRLQSLEHPLMRVHWHEHETACEQLSQAGYRMLNVPALPGNQLQLIDDWQQIFDGLIQDIDAATINVDLEFYIWSSGGRSDEVIEAIERACGRGVSCRILLDAIGSRPFLRSKDTKRLRAAGAIVQPALPGSLWRLPFVRFDLRLHRKIVLVDDQIAWTGSLNLVDPRYFKKEAGVGHWIDAMTRIQGPAVEALAITFQADWHIETTARTDDLPDLTGDQAITKHGSSIVQVLPSGPANNTEAIEQILLTAIYSARKEVVITTPYLVPSDSLQMALSSAAQRGVKVIVIVPEKVDSLLVHYASRAFNGQLMDAGVWIAQFRGGLLHTKSVTIDGEFCLFGSLNMDPRSLRLNFEVTLAIYDKLFTHQLRALQQSYLDQSHLTDIHTWKHRPVATRFVENVARLLGPLL